MVQEGKIWIGSREDGTRVYLLPEMAARHGLIAGATGTGKTVTLKVLSEAFSDLGVPVFLSDVKGDLAGMVSPAADSEDMQRRIQKFGLAQAGFEYKGYPAEFFDIYGKRGIQLRTTVSEMGPLLLSRILGLNDTQSALLSIAFQIADAENLLLIDIKDLKALLNFINDNRKVYESSYGRISPASIAVIIRSLAALEGAGGNRFFGETAFDIRDFLRTDQDGRGIISILDSSSLIANGTLYSTFLLWLLSELFEVLPEAGDLEKPKLVFFFDEAHLLFDGAPKALLDKIGQVVKLIRSKGVGVYFCTQNPKDIPDGVLAQLGNKIEHALRAYTPSEQKAVRTASDAFRTNPAFDTYETMLSLGIGEALVSLLGPDGVPGIAEKILVLPPQSRIGAIDDLTRQQTMNRSSLAQKYANAVDPDSAYEFLQRKLGKEAALRQKEEEEAQRAKQEEAAARAREKEEEKEQKARSRSYKQAAKSVGSSVAGTLGREVGKNVGESMFGKFGKTLGGNLGASLGRGIMSTLFKLR